MADESRYKKIDLRPYYAFGPFTLLKLLGSLVLLSLALVCVYEYLI